MRDLGDTGAEERARLAWFDEQETRNLDRLEEGAKTITQLVTGLYGVLFGVLALSNQPAYLKRPVVQALGGLSLLAFFVALLAALAVVYPVRTTYQRDNLSQMERGYTAMTRRKHTGLRVALIAFVLGTACLAGLIAAVARGW